MAQKLFVKTTGPHGNPVMKEVNVLRSWQESDGRQIYLHANGVYGYKDGSPIAKAQELDIIGDPTQRKMAQAWWNRVGIQLSGGHYDKLREETEKRQMEGLPVIAEGESNLDAVTYIRRPLKDKRKKAFGDPAPWPEFGFTQRPDWWGQASGIDLGAYRYEILSSEDVDAGDEAESGKGKAESGEEGSGKGEAESGKGKAASGPDGPTPRRESGKQTAEPVSGESF